MLKYETLTVHAIMGAYLSLCRKKKDCVNPVVMYHAYPQISKMADNL